MCTEVRKDCLCRNDQFIGVSEVVLYQNAAFKHPVPYSLNGGIQLAAAGAKQVPLPREGETTCGVGSGPLVGSICG